MHRHVPACTGACLCMYRLRHRHKVAHACTNTCWRICWRTIPLHHWCPSPPAPRPHRCLHPSRPQRCLHSTPKHSACINQSAGRLRAYCNCMLQHVMLSTVAQPRPMFNAVGCAGPRMGTYSLWKGTMAERAAEGPTSAAVVAGTLLCSPTSYSSRNGHSLTSSEQGPNRHDPTSANQQMHNARNHSLKHSKNPESCVSYLSVCWCPCHPQQACP